MGFENLKLKDCLDLVIDNRGKSPKSSKEYYSSYIPLIEVNAIATFSPFIDFNSIKKYVDPDTYSTWFRNGHPEKGDVLISTVGSIGEVCIVNDEKICIAQNIVALRADKNVIDQKYLFYVLNNKATLQLLKSLNISSVQPSLKVPHLLGIEIDVPSLSIQSKIANLLWSFDQMIDCNILLIENLEQLAQALFKRWFVDFEFPNENGDPYKSSGGEMVESELGMIPASWHLGTAKEILEFSPKESLKKGNFATYVEMKNLNSSAMVHEWNQREFKGSGSKFRNGDTLLARITPCLENGKVGFVDFLEKEDIGWGSTEFIVIRSKEGIASLFSYFLISESRFKDYAIANLNGSSGRQRVKAETLADFKLAVPPLKIINAFTDIIQPIINNMSNLKQQNISLQQLRDTLLPKLLSGEIELPEETEVTEDVPIS